MDTGGVPLTGYKLYQLKDGEIEAFLAFDGTDQPEILQTTLSGLDLDTDYSFYVAALNPFEGAESEHSTFRLGGLPGPPG